MSITLEDAKIEVARTLGGQNDPDELRAAGEAINRAIKTWNRENTWDFMRLDNLSNFTVAAITSSGAGNVILTTTVPNGFANVYVGTTVSGTSIVAGTKVLTKTSNTVIVVDTNLAGAIVAATLTFTGPIPIIAGVSDYALPYRVMKPSYARLVNARLYLDYVRSRMANMIVDPKNDTYTGIWGYQYQAVSGTPDSTSGVYPLPTTYLRILSTPDAGYSGDTLAHECFRAIQTFLNDVSVADEARVLDVPEEYEDALLQMAEYEYMSNKDSEIPRTDDRRSRAFASLFKAIRHDRNIPDEETSVIPSREWMSSGSFRGRRTHEWE
jgi:hypothetical protein